MPSYDLMSVSASTPVAFSKRSASAGLPLHRNFRVANQKVAIDVDLENNSLQGRTEITVQSYESILNFVSFDCRQMEITSVLVNQRRAQYLFQDHLKEEYEAMCEDGKNSIFSDVEQHHLYKSKMKKMYSGENTQELSIFIPDNMRLQQQDYTMHNTPNGYRESPGSHRTMATHPEITYKPITIVIEYSVVSPQTGLHFVGGKGSALDKSEWHAYTTNSVIGVSTSSWVPCVDSLWEKPTWEVEISVPKTVKQIGVSRVIGSDFDMEQDEDDDDDSSEIVVVGADFSTQVESAHPFDLAKKKITYHVLAPTSAHHIGWAVGPFVQTPLLNLEEENQPEAVQEKDTTAVPSAVYCLPSQVNDAINSTIFLYKAIDFYSREFGSFPFTSYGLVFVADMDVDANGFGGLSIFSSRLLYPPSAIEPIFETTYALASALAEQWSGIYLVPKTYNDLWTTVGIAHFMTLQFIRSLMGVNEYKYRVKKQSDQICEEDVGKPPLSKPFLRFPVSLDELDFVKLKSPIVMFILDRRMTKTDKSFGLTRVIPKIFVQAMSGDLPNGCLSTHHFQHVCEKVGHNKLESFFRQWVHGSGVPIFSVTQRFNKKRMFIEMGIRQVQNQETERLHPKGETFIAEATRELEDHTDNSHLPVFTGPMTIRIHEADGTPYEHIVDLKGDFTKLDIQYNTKYKRLKRSQKQLKSEKEARENAEDDDTLLLHCLGDILQTEKEMTDWNLTDWTKEEEEKMTNEAFEWIRVDADFEWICKIQLNQPDYMYASQLQQDRDVEAQLQSIQYFALCSPSPLYSSIMLRTLMDSRYYYGVRLEAAMAMAKFAKEQVGWIGYKHLLKVFRHLFCFENSLVPLPNDFSDFPKYLIKKGILKALSTIRDTSGNTPLDIRKFLLDTLKYNQNLNNPYTDTYYLAELIGVLVDTIVSNATIDNREKLTDVDRQFLDDAIAEITRLQKVDELTQTIGLVGVTAMKGKLRLARRGLYKFSPEDLLERAANLDSKEMRMLAFEGLFSMGALKNESILKFFFLSTIFEKSLQAKHGFIKTFINSIGNAVVEGCGIELDEDELEKEINVDEEDIEPTDGGLVVVEENSSNEAAFESRRDAAARATLTGAIELLRRDFSEYKPLRELLWAAVRHPLIGIAEKRDLYDVLFVTVPAYDFLPVTLDIPREKKIRALNVGDCKVVLKREGLIKISLTKLAMHKPAAPKAKTSTKPIIKFSVKKEAKSTYKAEIKRSATGPLRFVKIDSRHKTILVSSDPLKLSKKVTLRLSKEKLREAEQRMRAKELGVTLPLPMPAAPKITLRAPIMQPFSSSASSTPETTVDAPKTKLKLKFKF